MINLGAVTRTRGRESGIHLEYYVPHSIFKFYGMGNANGFCSKTENIYGMTLYLLGEGTYPPGNDAPTKKDEAQELQNFKRLIVTDLKLLEDQGHTDPLSLPICVNEKGAKRYLIDLHEQVHAKFRQIDARSNGRLDVERMIYMGLMRLLGPVHGREAVRNIVELSIARGWSPRAYPMHLEEGMAYGQQLIDFTKSYNHMAPRLKEWRKSIRSEGQETASKIPINLTKFYRYRNGVHSLGNGTGLKPVVKKISDKFGSVYRFAEWMEKNLTPEMVAAFTPEVIWISSQRTIEQLHSEAENRQHLRRKK